MNIKAQYKLAYSLLRDPDYGLWDYRTYKIVCDASGISEIAQNAAIRSYLES